MAVDLARVIAETRERALADPIYHFEKIWRDNKGRRVKCAEHHKVILRSLERGRLARIPVLVLAPMGCGKTEIGLGFSLRLMDIEPTTRLGIVGDMDDHAGQRVRVLKRYMEENEDHQRLFPDVSVSENRTSTLKVFSTTANKYAKDESVEGAGVKSSGTGSRKDKIFFDDCVTEANAILNPADRPRVISGFRGTWLTRLEPDTGWWYYIGTVYAADDLTHVLMENPDIAVITMAVSEEFDCYEVTERWPGGETREYTLPLWEGKWDETAYRKKYVELVSGGEGSKWYSGYRNIVIDPNTAPFKREWFSRTVLVPDWMKYKVRVMYADPASSQDKKADFYAGVVLGWDPQKKAAVVIHKWKVREPLTARIKRYLDVWEHFRPVDDGVEGKHELSFREALKREAADRGLSARCRAINHGPDSEKIARIGALSPLIEASKILFDGAVHPEFWDEAALFPRAKHDDLLDALEGAWQLLRKIIWRNLKIPRTFNPDAQAETEARTGRSPAYKVPPLKGKYHSHNRNARNLLWGE